MHNNLADVRQFDRMSVAFGSLIVAAALVNPLAFTALLSVLPAISKHYADVHNSPVLVRGLVSVVSIALVVAAPLAGFLAERIGFRRVLLTAIAVFTLAGVSGFIIENIWVLLASRLLLGLADACIGTLVIALIAARLDPLMRNRWIGWYTFAAAAGALIFIPLSGVIAQIGWRYVFLLYAVGLPILLCAALAVKPEGGVPEASKQSKPSKVHYFPLALVAIGIASGAVENTTHIFLPFHLGELGEHTPSRIAQAVLPIAVGGALSAFFYGHLRVILSIGWTFVLAFLTGGIALIWLGLTGSYLIILIAATLLGLGVGLLAPNLNAYAAVFGNPAHQARDIGFARGAFFAGAPIAQLLLEPVSGRAGAGSAIVALGCASLLLMLWPLLQRRRMADS